MKEKEGHIVAKFGGSSIADSEGVRRAADIVAENPDRRFVVVSAPGKRTSKDQKITQLLITLNELRSKSRPYEEFFHEIIAPRFLEMGSDLSLHSSVAGWLNNVYEGITKGENNDWVLSRGEWMMGRIFSSFMGGSFVDASRLIQMRESGQVDPLTYLLIKEQLSGDSLHVIPGFYGRLDSGAIKVFKRGGSDITGAIVARGVGAKLYENWTDVDGLLAADPRIVDNPKTIERITYGEVRELSYRGAEVLQKDTIRPVFDVDIPINIRNTFNPDHTGTMITRDRFTDWGEGIIGIAGKSGFMSFKTLKMGMDEETGIGEAILDVFKSNDVSYEHAPSTVDSMSVIVGKDEIDGKTGRIVDGIRRSVKPDFVGASDNMGLVCLVGEGISKNVGEIMMGALSALRIAGIDMKMITYPPQGNNITIGVEGSKVSDAIRLLYEKLIS